MNLILEKSKYVDYYTYIDKIFSKIPQLRKLHWLITDLEFNYCTEPSLQGDAPIFIDGKSLNKIVQASKIQFIWAVFSGYKDRLKNIPEELPYANGNPNFWKGKPKPQANGAEIEIVCWDSSYTLFINVSIDVAKKLKELYPDIHDLDKKNLVRVPTIT